jgi:hypothetical protein
VATPIQWQWLTRWRRAKAGRRKRHAVKSYHRWRELRFLYTPDDGCYAR